ncbi:MAG: hypothetical protein SFX72_21700 [Isosphaeraceae bacterium]|nr:hypothetical protein [Isosphaeraceae bacterium]
MDELTAVYATGGVIVGYFLLQVVRKRFDPFAPTWMFLLGWVQIYVIQPITLHEYALRVRGIEVTTEANVRALWAVVLFLVCYHFGPGRSASRIVPAPPARWSLAALVAICPVLVVWGLVCGFYIARSVTTTERVQLDPEAVLLLQFPILTLVAAILLIVTGRSLERPRPLVALMGLSISAFYILLWMFNGKRSVSLLAVLATVCAWYVPKFKRPSWPTLAVTALAGALAVSISIGWRNDRKHERSITGFVEHMMEFDPGLILLNLNIESETEENAPDFGYKSYETLEYGGYLLMLSTVPELSDYDYGAPYLRIVSTFIPRILWPDKPLYGRDAWIAAWIAGSEFRRKPDFTGPAIGILGACQLNGGAVATAIVIGFLGVFLRSAYEYYRANAHKPWAQAWWALTFYNAWFMTVNDDPFVWFYYAYGFTTFPPLVALWLYNKLAEAGRPVEVEHDGSLGISAVAPLV